jgi:hypothetical protein
LRYDRQIDAADDAADDNIVYVFKHGGGISRNVTL